MDFLETHFEETRIIIINHVNTNLPTTDESGKGRLRLLAERLSNIEQTKYLEISNERLKDFEEKMKNLGFSITYTEDLTENYKQKLIKFIGSGLKEYLLRQDK
jgi:hypothetical protein